MALGDAVATTKQVVEWFREALFPVFCLGCHQEGRWLCAACEAGAPEATIQRCVFCGVVSAYGQTCTRCARRHTLAGVTVRGRYDEWRWPSLIQAWKYGSARDLDDVVVKLFLPALTIVPARPEVIVSIPLAKRRERDRGFNQAQVLADVAAQVFRVPCVRALERVRNTSAQATLTSTDRAVNLRGAFACVDPASIHGKCCLLVDDVVTTGATLEEAASQLKAAGVISVWAIAIARSDIT